MAEESRKGMKRTFSSMSSNLDLEGLGGEFLDDIDPFMVGFLPSFCEEPDIHVEFGGKYATSKSPSSLATNNHSSQGHAVLPHIDCGHNDLSLLALGAEQKSEEHNRTASSSSSSSAAVATSSSASRNNVKLAPSPAVRANERNGIQNRKQAIQEVMQLPSKIMGAFNNGKLDEISGLIEHFFVENCTVKTPARDVEKYGRNEIYKFYKAVFDDYPDAVMVFKDIRMTDKYDLKYKFYFTGTLEQPRSGEKPYSKGTIVAHVKLSKYTPDEIMQMTQRERELREANKRIQVLVKGETHYHFNRSFKVTSIEIDYSVTAFEDASS